MKNFIKTNWKKVAAGTAALIVLLAIFMLSTPAKADDENIDFRAEWDAEEYAETYKPIEVPEELSEYEYDEEDMEEAYCEGFMDGVDFVCALIEKNLGEEAMEDMRNSIDNAGIGQAFEVYVENKDYWENPEVLLKILEECL